MADIATDFTVTDLCDREVAAVAALTAALDPLDPEARDRVLLWAHSRFRSPAEDTDAEDVLPRTLWFDDLPAKGDVIHVSAGAEFPVVHINAELGGDQLVWRMSARRDATAEAAPVAGIGEPAT